MTSSFFFVFVVIMGAFVTVNLVLASIMFQFLVLEKSMPLPGSSSLYAAAFDDGIDTKKHKYMVLYPV